MVAFAAALPCVPADTPALASFDLAGLSSLYRGFDAALEAFQGIFNQPRTKGEASDRIEAEIERCTDAMQAIATETERRQPTSRDERELRADVLVRWGLMCGAWPDIAAAAGSLGGAAT